MTTFHLRQLDCGRVVLDTNTRGSLRSIVAASWGDARSQIEDYEFSHRPGYGYYTE